MGGGEQNEGLGMKPSVLFSCALWLAAVLKPIFVSKAEEDESLVPVLLR